MHATFRVNFKTLPNVVLAVCTVVLRFGTSKFFFIIFNQSGVRKRWADAVYTDEVNHELGPAGFNYHKYSWYLCYRKQRVLCKNNTSGVISVSSGVFQGSHLGPIIFFPFINHLPKVLQFSNISMYADDVKIFFSYTIWLEKLSKMVQYKLNENKLTLM